MSHVCIKARLVHSTLHQFHTIMIRCPAVGWCLLMFLFGRWGAMMSQIFQPSPYCAPASARRAWRSRTWRSRCSPGDVVAAFLRSFTDLDRNRLKRGSHSGHETRSSQTQRQRVRPGESLTLLPNLSPFFLFSLSHCSSLHLSTGVCWMLTSCCSVCSRLTFPKGHFPRLAECAHFHYETVDFGNVQVSSKNTLQGVMKLQNHVFGWCPVAILVMCSRNVPLLNCAVAQQPIVVLTWHSQSCWTADEDKY